MSLATFLNQSNRRVCSSYEGWKHLNHLGLKTACFRAHVFLEVERFAAITVHSRRCKCRIFTTSCIPRCFMKGGKERKYLERNRNSTTNVTHTASNQTSACAARCFFDSRSHFHLSGKYTSSHHEDFRRSCFGLVPFGFCQCLHWSSFGYPCCRTSQEGHPCRPKEGRQEGRPHEA